MIPDLVLGTGQIVYWATVLVPAYLLGSIPFGLILGRLAGVGDVRQRGSGNIGATNVLRTGRRDLALATLVLDAAKGTLAVVLALRFGPEPAGWAALAAVTGHMFPVWLGFRGGKGVATTFGALLALVGALGALVVGAPLLLWGLLELQRAGHLPIRLPGDPAHLPSLILIALLITFRHHANVRRLLKGTEPEIDLGRGTRDQPGPS